MILFRRDAKKEWEKDRVALDNSLEVASQEEADGLTDYEESMDEAYNELKSLPLRIACIGSRAISVKMEKLMESIGEEIVKRGHYIATGNADGSDAAYARGGNRVDPTKVIIYLPWRTYNQNYIVKGNRVTWEIKPEWQVVAAAHHPAYQSFIDNDKRGVRALMDRNAGILSKSDKVIAYLNHNKSGGGGTGHGWRIANAMNIPRLDLALKEVSLDDVVKWIDESI